VNPDAYERGTVFVQCQGCDVWHKLVDNMGLIEEYDLTQMPLSDAGQVLRSKTLTPKDLIEASEAGDGIDAATSVASVGSGSEQGSITDFEG
jgi:hypothetical protein